MKQMNLGLAAPNLVCICVDNVKDNRIEGRIYHYYAEKPEIIKDTMQLLRILEAFYDQIDFPQAAEQLREFVNDSDEVKRRKRLPRPVTNREFMMKQSGTCGTFLLYVQYRQNATWQGQIMWKERGKTLEFRSALEFLILLDNALAAYKEQNIIT